MLTDESIDLDNSPHIRRTVQALVDFRGGTLQGARILDLGSAHGLYTIECAQRGADALGVEGRAAWVRHADAAKSALGLDRATFHQNDVRNVSKDAYGTFDVCLCLGLLYHLGAGDARGLLQNLYDMTKEFVIVDTQVALSPQEKLTLGGLEYSGCTFPEHPPGSSPEAIEANLGAALDANASFWFTLPSLINLLGDIGFTSVVQLQWPTDYMYRNGEFCLHEDYVTLIAIKGERVGEVYGTSAREGQLERSPEDPAAFVLERQWSQIGWSNKRPVPEAPHGDAPEAQALGTIRPQRTISHRIKAAVQAFRA